MYATTPTVLYILCFLLISWREDVEGFRIKISDKCVLYIVI